jgi:hypothetical protein
MSSDQGCQLIPVAAALPAGGEAGEQPAEETTAAERSPRVKSDRSCIRAPSPRRGDQSVAAGDAEVFLQVDEAASPSQGLLPVAKLIADMFLYHGQIECTMHRDNRARCPT